MTVSKIRAQIVVEKTSWIRRMLEELGALPCATLEDFLSDRRTAAAAESYLRRGLEALLDLGRHLLAKGFARAVVEYKEIALELREKGVLDESEAAILREMAGYRNRMVHFYDEIGKEELYHLCTERAADIERVLDAILMWVNAHPEMIDRS